MIPATISMTVKFFFLRKKRNYSKNQHKSYCSLFFFFCCFCSKEKVQYRQQSTYVFNCFLFCFLFLGRGAIPATIGIISGDIYVGLTKEQIHFLGEQNTKVEKTSRRDIPNVLSKVMPILQ